MLTRTKLFLLIAAGVIWLAGTALLLHVLLFVRLPDPEVYPRNPLGQRCQRMSDFLHYPPRPVAASGCVSTWKNVACLIDEKRNLIEELSGDMPKSPGRPTAMMPSAGKSYR